MKIIFLMVFPVLLTACAGWPGERAAPVVRVLDAAQVTECRTAGSVHVSVEDRLGSLQQIDGAVRHELEMLAKGSALQLQGNAIVPIGAIDRGNQSFAVYRCP